jgi:hypothetical protein
MGQDTQQLRREIEVTRSDMTDTLDAIGDRVSPGRVAQRQKNKVVGTVRSVKDRVMGTAQETQSHLAHSVDSVRGTVTGAAEQTTDTVKHLPDAVAHRTEGAPMVAGALAFGVGFLVAAALPASESEKEMSAKVMETLEPVKEEVVGAAQDMAHNLKQPAMEAAQTVKDAAAEGAQAVGSTVRDAADETKQRATESVQAVQHAETRPSSD